MTIFVYSILGILSIIPLSLLALILNVIQVASLLLRPFSKSGVRNISCWVGDMFWSASVLFSRWIHDIQIDIEGDTPLPGDNALLIVNHQMMTDIPILLDFTYRHRRLNNLKWFVKDSLKYVPGIGWGMYFMDCLFIKRNWERDRSSIEKVFHNITTDNVPIWLVLFAEGTRSTPNKISRSQSYAREKNLPVLNQVQIPRTKGFLATMEGLRNHLTAVYDITIHYNPGPPTLFEWIQGKACRYRLKMVRHPINTLPQEPQALTEWLIQCFVGKERWLEACKKENS